MTEEISQLQFRAFQLLFNKAFDEYELKVIDAEIYALKIVELCRTGK